MAGRNDEVDTSASAAIGEELRRARESLGWTRAELAARLPFSIHVQTLAGYERGSVQCAMSRFLQLCLTMGVSAPDLLAWALQRAEIGLPVTGLQIDLRAVIRSKAPDLLPLRRWARKKLEDDPAGTGIARLAWPVAQEMASLFGMDQAGFVQRLVQFTPLPTPQLL